MLGQVKPPVATAEEIQSSGLEIIKASALEEYERTNNVASNCIEKVSIKAFMFELHLFKPLVFDLS